MRIDLDVDKPSGIYINSVTLNNRVAVECLIAFLQMNADKLWPKGTK